MSELKHSVRPTPGGFALPAVLLRDGELHLYDQRGLRARRSLDPRREPDIGVWHVP